MPDPIERFMAWVGGAPEGTIASLERAEKNEKNKPPTLEAWFDRTPDGQVLFHPWGRLSKRGYVIASQSDLQKLRRRINLWMGLSTTAAYAAMHRYGYLVGLAVMTACCVFYGVWMRIALRGLPREMPKPAA
jgi:hypothetical protein